MGYSLWSGSFYVLGPIYLVFVAYAKVNVKISLGVESDSTMRAGHERERELTFTSFPSLSFQPHGISSIQFTLHNFPANKRFPVITVLCLVFPGVEVNSGAFQVSF